MSILQLLFVVSLVFPLSHGYPIEDSEEIFSTISHLIENSDNATAKEIDDCREAFQRFTTYMEDLESDDEITRLQRMDRSCESLAEAVTCMESVDLPPMLTFLFRFGMIVPEFACRLYEDSPLKKCLRENNVKVSEVDFKTLEKFVTEKCAVVEMKNLEKNKKQVPMETKKYGDSPSQIQYFE